MLANVKIHTHGRTLQGIHKIVCGKYYTRSHRHGSYRPRPRVLPGRMYSIWKFSTSSFAAKCTKNI